MIKSLFAVAALSSLSAFADAAPAPKMPVQSVVPNPSARWGVTGGANLFITAEALVFKIATDTQPYAYTVDTAYNITDYHVETDYKWGFRVAAGYNMSHDKWDVLVTYSRFNVSNSSTTNDPAVGSLFSYFSSTAMQSVHDRWEVDFNMFDIEQGRQFFVSKYLRLRPKFGLRNLFLDNNQKVSMTGLSGSTAYQINNRDHFWGMGVLAGLDTVWMLAKGFSIYGNVGLAGLFGYNNPKQTVQTSNTASHYDKSGHLEQTKGNLDLALGLRWDKNFYDDRYHIGFNFGFEQHMFFNLGRNNFGDNQLGGSGEYQAYAGRSGNDFTLSGFAFGARFDF